MSENDGVIRDARLLGTLATGTRGMIARQLDLAEGNREWLGDEKAVLCICHMDKAYIQGFRHIRYERASAVSEGAACCDYRLRFDTEKH